MKLVFSKSTPITAVFLSLGIGFNILTVSCADSRLYQCQQIIAVTNKIYEETSKNSQTKDEQIALGVADTFDAVAEEMEGLKISNEELQEYRDGFVKLYRENAEATREFVRALQAKEVKTAKSTKEKLQKIGSREKTLVNGINSYCQVTSG